MALPLTPAHIQRVRGSTARVVAFKGELAEVRNLFLNRRYKQCAELCERLQNAQIHPLHKTFLCFYRALSYESLGLVSHNYSTSKIVFFDLAKEALSSALANLPFPYISTEEGLYEQPERSPSLQPFSAQSRCNEGSVPRTSTINFGSVTATESISSLYSINDEDQACALPNPFENVLRQTIRTPINANKAMENLENAARAPGSMMTGLQCELDSIVQHKFRLTQSLSSQHILQDSCIPSPLFSRKPKHFTSRAPNANTDTSPPKRSAGSNSLQKESSTKTPPSRPPFASNNGSRLLQTPQRATAVQTLIARFESTLPSGSRITTPQTHCFTRADHTFSPFLKNPHLEAYLSSASLTRYHVLLTEFRAQLDRHLCDVLVRIEQVQEIQAAREARRSEARINKRLASFWSLTAVDDGPIARSAEQTRKLRIEQLRREGWDVGKHKHGWKGEAHYEALRRRVDRECDELERLDVERVRMTKNPGNCAAQA